MKLIDDRLVGQEWETVLKVDKLPEPPPGDKATEPAQDPAKDPEKEQPKTLKRNKKVTFIFKFG